MIRIFLGVWILVGATSCASGRTITETTYGKEQSRFASSCTNMILSVERVDTMIRIHSNGRYVKRVKSEDSYRSLTDDFTLTVGESFEMAPDHHAYATFTLIGIEDNGVLIRYESSFDHRSFGQAKITKDVGEFRWPYIKEQ